MNLIEIYKCLSDETRLRIVNLLSVSPLCVCHIQTVLGKSQVLISQHLAYLRDRKVVTARRYQNWMIYSLPSIRSSSLEGTLHCMQNAAKSDPILRRDCARLAKVMGSKPVRTLLDEGCCARPAAVVVKKSCRKQPAKKDVSL